VLGDSAGKLELIILPAGRGTGEFTLHCILVFFRRMSLRLYVIVSWLCIALVCLFVCSLAAAASPVDAAEFFIRLRYVLIWNWPIVAVVVLLPAFF